MANCTSKPILYGLGVLEQNNKKVVRSYEKNETRPARFRSSSQLSGLRSIIKIFRPYLVLVATLPKDGPRLHRTTSNSVCVPRTGRTEPLPTMGLVPIPSLLARHLPRLAPYGTLSSVPTWIIIPHPQEAEMPRCHQRPWRITHTCCR